MGGSAGAGRRGVIQVRNGAQGWWWYTLVRVTGGSSAGVTGRERVEGEGVRSAGRTEVRREEGKGLQGKAAAREGSPRSNASYGAAIGARLPRRGRRPPRELCHAFRRRSLVFCRPPRRARVRGLTALAAPYHRARPSLPCLVSWEPFVLEHDPPASSRARLVLLCPEPSDEDRVRNTQGARRTQRVGTGRPEGGRRFSVRGALDASPRGVRDVRT
ncbi:hypothetical protein C8Q79DRAFT_974075 [Trametes meyenii]|nr:hypothetical protein C8Q79DRAFT_974075 [Trametes meyenii]